MRQLAAACGGLRQVEAGNLMAAAMDLDEAAPAREVVAPRTAGLDEAAPAREVASPRTPDQTGRGVGGRQGGAAAGAGAGAEAVGGRGDFSAVGWLRQISKHLSHIEKRMMESAFLGHEVVRQVCQVIETFSPPLGGIGGG